MAQVVMIDGLGLCEHCNALMTIEGMSGEAMNAVWKCFSCKGEISHKSFGYESEKGNKIAWVGPEGKWVSEKPTQRFTLGNWDISVHGPIAF